MDEEIIKQPITEELPVVPEVPSLRSLNDIMADLKGLGIEECEELLTFEIGGKKISLRISNIPTEDEINALLASEEYKGHLWVQKVRCEILSRAISWIEGKSITGDEIVVHPTKPGYEVNIRVALRDLIMTWGMEVVLILWKILMVHNQKLEDRLTQSFPDSALFTEVERRFMERVMQEIEATSKEVVNDVVEKAVKDVAEATK